MNTNTLEKVRRKNSNKIVRTKSIIRSPSEENNFNNPSRLKNESENDKIVSYITAFNIFDKNKRGHHSVEF